MKSIINFCNILNTNAIGGGDSLLKGIFANKSPLIVFPVFLFFSCSQASKDDQRESSEAGCDTINIYADDSWKDTIEVDNSKQTRVVRGFISHPENTKNGGK